MIDRVLPPPVMPTAPPESALPGGARAFWVQWLRAQARLRKPVTLSPTAAAELAALLSPPPDAHEAR